MLKSTLELCGEGSLLPPGCKSLQAERTGCGPPFLWYPLLPGSHNQKHLQDAQQSPAISKSSFSWLSDGTQSKSRSILCPSCRDGQGPWPAHSLSSTMWLHAVCKHSGAQSNFKLNRAEHMATRCCVPQPVLSSCASSLSFSRTGKSWTQGIKYRQYRQEVKRLLCHSRQIRPLITSMARNS